MLHPELSSQDRRIARIVLDANKALHRVAQQI